MRGEMDEDQAFWKKAGLIGLLEGGREREGEGEREGGK